MVKKAPRAKRILSKGAEDASNYEGAYHAGKRQFPGAAKRTPIGLHATERTMERRVTAAQSSQESNK